MGGVENSGILLGISSFLPDIINETFKTLYLVSLECTMSIGDFKD